VPFPPFEEDLSELGPLLDLSPTGLNKSVGILDVSRRNLERVSFPPFTKDLSRTEFSPTGLKKLVGIFDVSRGVLTWKYWVLDTESGDLRFGFRATHLDLWKCVAKLEDSGSIELQILELPNYNSPPQRSTDSPIAQIGAATSRRSWQILTSRTSDDRQNYELTRRNALQLNATTISTRSTGKHKVRLSGPGVISLGNTRQGNQKPINLFICATQQLSFSRI